MRHLIFFLMINLLAWSTVQGQLYSETFDIEGKGVAGTGPETPPVFDLTGVDWTLSGDFSGLIATSDYFEVDDGVLEGRDVDEIVCFESPEIDISGAPSVNFSVDLSESGTHESSDFIDITLFVDDVPVNIDDYLGMGSATRTIVDDFSPLTVFQTGISGSTLQIQICVLNNAGSEYLRIDNVTVTENAPMPCVISDLERMDSGICSDNGTPFIEDDTFVSNIMVTYENAPVEGDLVLELNGEVVASAAVEGGTAFAFKNIALPADGSEMVMTAYFTEDLGCQYTENIGFALQPCSVMPDCTYPFFSEYIEGSGNNKCLEIYNPTESDIALDDYMVQMHFNGNPNPGNTITFEEGAVLPAGGTYVICSTAADDEFLDLADEATGGSSWFNGDDAVALVGLGFLDGENVRVDVIGQIGFDPGSQWSNGGVNTQNRTIRRAPFVTAGDNNGFNAFDPSAEWEGLAINTEYGLGYHGSFCLEPGVPFGWNPFTIGCDGGNYSYNDLNGQWTLTSECFNPDGGQDDLTFAFQDQCGDLELSAKLETLNGLGKAGLMLRESLDPGSKYVWIYKVSNSSAVRWAIRKTENGVPQVQTKFAFTKKWLRIKRDGYVFSGYTSFNGVVWKKEFQSYVFMDDCLFAGPAMHSNVDFSTTTAIFSNVEFGGGTGTLQSAVSETLETVGEDRAATTTVTESLPELSQEVDVREVTLRPNPVANWLEVDLPKDFGTEIQLTIVDMNGKVIYTANVENEMTTIALDIATLNLSQGTYLLNMRSENQNVTKRFVKAQ